MNPKILFRLALAALVLVGLALWLGSGRGPERELEAGQAMVPGLAEAINDVDRVVLRGAGGEVLATLRREGEGWVLAERGDYAVDLGPLRALLLGLADARRVEAKTARPERHAELGVEDVTAEDAYGVEVTAHAGDRAFAVIVGRNRGGGAVGTYARLAGEDQSWLVDANIAVERDPARWLVREVSAIDDDRLLSVLVEHGDGDRVEITRGEDGEGELGLATLPRGREPASDYVAEATAGFLSGLRFDDVAPAADKAAPEDASRATFRARDGLVVDVDFWKDEAQTWATLSASLDGERASAWIEAEQAREQREHEALVAEAAARVPDGASADAEPADAPADGDDAAGGEAGDAAPPEAPLAATDPAADREARMAALRAEVEAFNARVGGWAYRIPSYKADNLTRRLEDYLASDGE